MKTDIPLKLLTTLRAADLIPLLGVPAASVIEVVVCELPMSKQFLDTLVRVRSPQGQEYLHRIEWQGYFDAAALWRLIGYMGLVGQDAPHRDDRQRGYAPDGDPGARVYTDQTGRLPDRRWSRSGYYRSGRPGWRATRSTSAGVPARTGDAAAGFVWCPMVPDHGFKPLVWMRPSGTPSWVAARAECTL